jgi:hypothetical protein
MAPRSQPRRLLPFSRLKYFAAACMFAIITYRYVYQNPAFQFGSKPRDAAGNSTLGVSTSPPFQETTSHNLILGSFDLNFTVPKDRGSLSRS